MLVQLLKTTFRILELRFEAWNLTKRNRVNEQLTGVFFKNNSQ